LIYKNSKNPTAQPHTAAFLAETGMAPLSRQFVMMGPNFLCETSHISNGREDFAKQAAAAIIKGVVGKTGKNMPANPSITKIIPQMR